MVVNCSSEGSTLPVMKSGYKKWTPGLWRREMSEASFDVLGIMHMATERALAEASKKDHPQGQASISVNSGGYEPRCKACNFPGHEEHDKELLTSKLSDSDYAKIVGCSSKRCGARSENNSKKP